MSGLPVGMDRERPLPEGESSGWIQWKGTEVCVDIRCKCGKLTHVDAAFMYYVQCPYCNTVYWANGHIQLVTLTDEEAKTVKDPCVAVRSDDPEDDDL